MSAYIRIDIVDIADMAKLMANAILILKTISR